MSLVSVGTSRGHHAVACAVEALEGRQLFSFTASVNFQPAGQPVPTGYVPDSGAVYADRGNGLSYGWLKNDNSATARVRNSILSPDARYDTLLHMQKSGNATWEISVPNGVYQVHVVAGDSDFINSRFVITAENTIVVNGIPTAANHWVEGTANANVYDGRLSIAPGTGASNDKICYVDITQTDLPLPPPVSALKWRPMANSLFTHSEGASFVANGKLYVIGGLSGPPVARTSVTEAYDPVANTWTRYSDSPVAGNDWTCAYDSTTGLAWLTACFLADADGGPTAEVYTYNVQTDAWSQQAPIPAPRGAGALAIVGRELHFFSGNDATGAAQTDHWRLNLDDPSATWVVDAPMPNAVGHLAAVTIGNTIFAIGGEHALDEANGNTTGIYAYSADTRLWTKAGTLPMPMSHASFSTIAVNGKVVIAGGTINNGRSQTESSSVLMWDPATNTWSKLTNLPAQRKSAAMGYINGNYVFAVGNQLTKPYLSLTTWVGY